MPELLSTLQAPTTQVLLCSVPGVLDFVSAILYQIPGIILLVVTTFAIFCVESDLNVDCCSICSLVISFTAVPLTVLSTTVLLTGSAISSTININSTMNTSGR